jgi:NADH:ubiquinone oxidoreductase subunit 6 (subunit J)
LDTKRLLRYVFESYDFDIAAAALGVLALNPMYSIMESPHRWLILAGITFGADVLTSMVMLIHDFSHGFIQIWVYAGLIMTIYFLARAFLEWKQDVEEELARRGEGRQ